MTDSPHAVRPVTGERDVDAALEEVDGLDDRPLEEHHPRLRAAQEALDRALHGAGTRQEPG